MAQVFVIGDSIAYGMWDRGGGWADRLKVFLFEKSLESGKANTTYYWPVYNLSVPGETTIGVVKRIESEIASRLNSEQENIIVFAIGINDTQIKKGMETEVPLEEFKENLREMYEVARRYSQKIIFVGLTRVDEAETAPIFWQTSVSYYNQEVEKYDQVLEQFCDYYSLPYLSLREIDFKDLLEDGIHPNTEGNKKIFEVVKDYFEKQLL